MIVVFELIGEVVGKRVPLWRIKLCCAKHASEACIYYLTDILS